MDIKKNRSFNKLTTIGFITAALTIGLLAFTNVKDSHANLLIGSDGGVNEIIMHEDNGPTQLGSYTSVEEHSIRYVDFDYFGVKAGGGYHAVLAENGYIGNNRATRLTSITSITVKYDATSPMMIALSNRNDGLGLNEKVEIASEVELLPANAPYYFRLYAGNAVTSIERIEIHYTCVEQAPNTYFIDNLSKQYSGVLGGTVFVVTRDGSDAILETKNLATNIVLDDGEISIDGDEITIAATDLSYVGTLSDNGHTISYKDAVGAFKDAVNGLDLKAVYMLEDYESYSISGTGIRQDANGMYGHKHLRGAYYSDYYDGSSGSPLGGPGWKLMGSSDYLDLTSDAHSGTKAALYKRSSAGAMRHISWDLYTGAAVVRGKGDTFSFWAKGVVNNAVVKPRVSYVSKITASNQTSSSDTAFDELTIPAGSPWTQYSFTINPAKQVYGFQLSFNSASGSAVYVPVDDVQIYTSANPWAEYNPVVPVTGVSVSPQTASVEVGKTVSLSATIAPANATNQDVEWSSADTDIATVSATGIVTGVDEGQVIITATTDDGSYTDSCLVDVTAPYIDPDSPVGKTYNAVATVPHPQTGEPMGVTVIMAFGEDYRAFVRIGDQDKYTTYTLLNNIVSLDTKNAGVGVFEGEFNETRTTLTKTSISGPYGAHIAELVLVASSGILEDGNDTTTAALQDKYLIEYGANWTTSGSSDRIEYKTSNPTPIEGDGCVKFKVGNFGRMRYKTKDLSQELGTFKNFGMWFYNNTGEDLTGTMYVYGPTLPSGYKNFAKFTLVSNGEWTYYTSGTGTDQAAITGWGIIFDGTTISTGHPCVDNVVLF
ncbi:MAG: Ig-like domain-containing protein [Bacilli bacterium]